MTVLVTEAANIENIYHMDPAWNPWIWSYNSLSKQLGSQYKSLFFPPIQIRYIIKNIKRVIIINNI